MQETRVRYLSQEDPLEEGVTTHSSIPAWRIPWTEGLQPWGYSLKNEERTMLFYEAPHKLSATLQDMLSA